MILRSISIFDAFPSHFFQPSWEIADPISTFLFSVLVLVTTITILKDILLVLMEGGQFHIFFIFSLQSCSHQAYLRLYDERGLFLFAIV